MNHKKDWLAQQAKASPHKLALAHAKEHWTYAELDMQVENAADHLDKLGLFTGSHVAVLLSNSPEFVIMIHALSRLGMVLVPINIRLTSLEISSQLVQSDCTSLVFDSATEGLLADINLPDLKFISVENISGGIQDHRRAPVQFDQNNVQSIVFTSGTTGMPKGAVLSFTNHYQSANASAYRLGILPEDRWLLCMPLYHIGGMAIVLRAAIYGIAVILQNRFEEENVLKVMNG